MRLSRYRHAAVMMTAAGVLCWATVGVSAQLVVTRIFSSSSGKSVGADVPQPVPVNHFQATGVQNALGGKDAAGYARILASTKLTQADMQNFLQRANTDTESRKEGDNYLKISMWTPFPIGSQVSEVAVRAGQQYLMKLLGSGGGVRGNGTLAGLVFIPGNIDTIELEVRHVPLDDWTRRPMCNARPAPVTTAGGQIQPPVVDQSRWSTTQKQLPWCPTLFLMDQMLVPGMAAQRLITNLDRFSPLSESLSRQLGGAVNLGDVVNLNQLDYQVNGNWFGMPLMSDTRVFMFNRTTLQRLQMKLPPPFGQWGQQPNNADYGSEWTWPKVIEYAQEMRTKLNAAAPFKFMAGWDEESFGGSVLGSGNQCAMGTSQARSAMTSVVSLMFSQSANPLANSDFIEQSSLDFKFWNSQPLNDVRETEPSFCCQDAPASAVGMGIVRPDQIKFGINRNGQFVADSQDPNAELLPAYIPGKTPYYGGFGLSMAEGALNPSIGWGFMQYLMYGEGRVFVRDLASISSNPPPFASMQGAAPFDSSNWNIFKTMNARGLSPHSPNPGSVVSSGMMMRKPFRLMLMEMYYKGVSMQSSIDRACARLNILSLPTCQRQVVEVPANECTSKYGFTTYRFPTSSLVFPNCQIAASQIVPAVGSVPCNYVDYRSAGGITSTVFNTVGMAFALVLLALLIAKQGQAKDAGMSLFLTSILLAGAIVLYITTFMYYWVPTQALCYTRGWLLAGGYVLVIGLLAAYSFFMSRNPPVSERALRTPDAKAAKYGVPPQIYERSDTQGLWKWKNRRVVLAMGILFVINVIFLLVWSLTGAGLQTVNISTPDFNGTNAVNFRVTTCSNGSLGVLGAMLAVNLLVAVTFVAFSTFGRDLDQRQHTAFKPRRMLLTSWLTLIILLIMISLSLLLAIGEWGRQLMVLFTIFGLTTLLLLVLVLPLIIDTLQHKVAIHPKQTDSQILPRMHLPLTQSMTTVRTAETSPQLSRGNIVEYDAQPNPDRYISRPLTTATFFTGESSFDSQSSMIQDATPMTYHDDMRSTRTSVPWMIAQPRKTYNPTQPSSLSRYVLPEEEMDSAQVELHERRDSARLAAEERVRTFEPFDFDKVFAEARAKEQQERQHLNVPQQQSQLSLEKTPVLSPVRLRFSNETEANRSVDRAAAAQRQTSMEIDYDSSPRTLPDGELISEVGPSARSSVQNTTRPQSLVVSRMHAVPVTYSVPSPTTITPAELAKLKFDNIENTESDPDEQKRQYQILRDSVQPLNSHWWGKGGSSGAK